MKITVHLSRPVKVAFVVYLLLSIIVTMFYIFTFGYAFWYTDKATIWLDIFALAIFLITFTFQFNPKTRLWSWFLLPPIYPLVLYSLSNMERFNINVIYLGLGIAVIMTSLAALLNWYFREESHRISE